ncbi:mRNA interferase toxin MqsR [Cupriavidus laharis]|uniref:mRNA interferase toxin MqsR n=1 Tax=Cupriavidus laharis TaxID=151654 RepID=A0ABN7YXD1_9BURK|nr:type II toxin-antitoxin system MqsR family toxin [Cupriavidus laharis]CAG9177953.1 mRNA interferase toxin MqsR [Cupriavidus laharis]
MNLDWGGVCDILLDLVPADFYKSMTTYQDHRVWQDVYRPATRYGGLYVKLTMADKVLVVSFKSR